MVFPGGALNHFTELDTPGIKQVAKTRIILTFCQTGEVATNFTSEKIGITVFIAINRRTSNKSRVSKVK